MKRNILFLIGALLAPSVYAASPPQAHEIVLRAFREDNPEILKPVYESSSITKKIKNKLLFDAAFENKINIVTYLLEQPEKKRPDINAQLYRYSAAKLIVTTALIAASGNGHDKIVELLLNAKADLNLQDNDGTTALIAASDKGYEKVVTLLLQAKADLNLQDNNGNTPLIIASFKGYEKIVELLLNAKADPNLQDNDGNTPLIAASDKGYEKVVTLLLQAKADLNLQDNNGNTPLIITSFKGYEKIVTLLLQAKADPNLQDNNGNTPLIATSFKGYEKIVTLLLQAKADPNLQDNNGNTPLIATSFKGYEKVATLLLQAKADPNLQDNNGNTPLIAASDKGYEKVVTLLLQAKADPNLQNNNGTTALILASNNGHDKIVELLLNTKADPNLQDNDGTTALILASGNGHDKIVELLLNAKANPNLQDNNGTAALILASNNGHDKIIELLLNAKADPNLQDNNGTAALITASEKGHHKIVELLLNAKADPNLQNNNGTAALITASEKGHHKIVELLLNAKADPNLQNNNGTAALITASEKGHHKIVTLLHNAIKKRKIVLNLIETMAKKGQVEKIPLFLKDNKVNYQNLLLDASKGGNQKTIQYLIGLPEGTRPDLNAQDHTGNTSLILALRESNNEIAKKLVQAGADPNKANHDGTTPLMSAVELGNKDIINVLLDNGANTDLQDKQGNTPLKIAIKKKLTDIARLLQSATVKSLAAKTKKKKRRKKPRKQQQPKEPVSLQEKESPPAQTPPKIVPIPKPEPVLTPEQMAEQQLKKDTQELWNYINEGKAKQVKTFLASEKTFDLNTRNQQGETLITFAVKKTIKDQAKRRFNTIQVLLRSEKTKGLTNTPNNSGKTPRAIANQANSKEIVTLLAKHGAIAETMHPCPRPHTEPERSQPELIQPEPKQEPQEQDTANDLLFAELSRGNRTKTETLKGIIRQDHGSLTRQRKAGKTPLMHAIESKVKEKELRYILKELTPEHINLEEQTEQRDTALTKAIRNGIWPWINLLLSHGALIRKEDIKTAQQLHDDEQRSHGNTEKAKKLWKNLTLLQQAKEHQNANKMLLKATQEPTENFEPIERVLGMGADINTKDEHGNTPLMYSIMTKNNVTAKGLIERNAQLNLQNKNGKTALILAVDTNNYDLADYLLQHGADETMSDTADATAYGYATANGYTDIANRILTYRALKALKKSGTIKHVLNRHTILGKNKKPTIIGTGPVIQNQPYMAHHKDKSTASFFPRSWNKEKIQKAIIHVLQKPEQLHEQPAQITEDNQVLRNALILRGFYEEIPIKVIISQTNDKHEPWKVFTAYPIIK